MITDERVVDAHHGSGVVTVRVVYHDDDGHVQAFDCRNNREIASDDGTLREAALVAYIQSLFEGQPWLRERSASAEDVRCEPLPKETMLDRFVAASALAPAAEEVLACQEAAHRQQPGESDEDYYKRIKVSAVFQPDAEGTFKQVYGKPDPF